MQNQSWYPRLAPLDVHAALGAFWHKQDLHCCKYDLQILDDARVGDVHQTRLELIVGGGVVFAVNLGIACQAGLGLKAEGGLRHFFAVLGSDLRAEEPVKASGSGLMHHKTCSPKSQIGGIFSDILQWIRAKINVYFVQNWFLWFSIIVKNIYRRKIGGQGAIKGRIDSEKGGGFVRKFASEMFS